MMESYKVSDGSASYYNPNADGPPQGGGKGIKGYHFYPVTERFEFFPVLHIPRVIGKTDKINGAKFAKVFYLIKRADLVSLVRRIGNPVGQI